MSHKKVKKRGILGILGILGSLELGVSINVTMPTRAQGKATQKWVVRQLDAHHGTFADMRSVPPPSCSLPAVLFCSIHHCAEKGIVPDPFDTPLRGEGHSPGHST